MTESESEYPNLVSTIIPVFNRPSLLKTAVKSVLDQTYRPIEILIVDDGSTDSTARVADELKSQHRDSIRVFKHQNQGPGPSRELGRVNARGEFLQYLDSDDQLLPNKFEDQVRALREHPECDIAYGVSRHLNTDGEVLADPFKWTATQKESIFPSLLVDRWWCTHTPLYKRSITDRIGPWTDMRWSQDWEYDARAGALGAKLVTTRTHVSEHYHHDGVRQTGGADWRGDPIRLRNRLELLEALWTCAQKAGVQDTAPERQHFARWAFKIGRECAAVDLRDEASRCLEIARDSAAGGPGAKGVELFRRISRVVGFKVAGRSARWSESFRGSRSASSMSQSFEDC